MKLPVSRPTASVTPHDHDVTVAGSGFALDPKQPRPQIKDEVITLRVRERLRYADSKLRSGGNNFGFSN
jgi:hypothetical protein